MYLATGHEAIDLDKPVTEKTGEDLNDTYDSHPNEAGFHVFRKAQVKGPHIQPS